MGRITGLRLSTQASAIWLGAALWALAAELRIVPPFGEAACSERIPRDKADAMTLAIAQHVFTAAIDKIVAVLHRRHFEHL